MQFESHSSAETLAIGYQLGAQLPSGSIVALFGELGAGKTALIKGIAQAAASWPPDDVCSPTFALMNIYQGAKNTLYHFDLYRLQGGGDFIALGFDEFLYSEKDISCIEWAERIDSLLPPECIRITLSHGGGDHRIIVVEGLP